MNVAELFVSLGITGTEKTAGALTGVKRGLQETGSMALETKAALVAALYAVERLFTASNRAGSGLQNFNAVVGVSTDTLQEYQYAAQQVGVSNDSVANTFKTLQSTMQKILMGEGVPKGLARVALTVDEMSPEDINEYAKAPQKLLMKLQEYAQKETSTSMRNEVLKSFGVGDDMIAALSRKAFRPEVMQKAPKYNQGEIGQLDKNNAAWANLGQKMEMAFGKFNAKHGGEIVAELSKIIDKVLQLADAFMILAEKLQLFELFGDAVKGWTAIFSGVSSAVDTISGAIDDPKKAETLKSNVKSFFVNDAPLYMETIGRGVMGDKSYEDQMKATDFVKSNMTQKPQEQRVSPRMPSDNARLRDEQRRLPESPRIPGQQPFELPRAPGQQKAAPEDRAKPKEPGMPGDRAGMVAPLAPTMPSSNQLAPAVPGNTVNAQQSTQTVTLNQNNTFQANDGKNIEKANKKAIDDITKTFRQLSAQSTGG